MGPTTIIHFAIVGLGYIGRRHFDMVQENPHTQVDAVIDIDPSVEDFCKSRAVPFFPSLEAFLSSNILETIDVVTIATPNGLHAMQACQCLSAGKYVLIEKPMALQVKDAEAIVALAEKMQRQVFVVMQNRFTPAIKWLQESVANNSFGDILILQMNCLWSRDHRYYLKGNWRGTQELDGGVLFTQYSHFMDVLLWIFGPLENLQHRAANYTHKGITSFDDSGIVLFDLSNGGMGSITYSTSVWDKNMEISLTVVGTKGSVKLDGPYLNKIAYVHGDGITMPRLDEIVHGNDYGEYQGSAANHRQVIQNVVNVLSGNATVATTGIEGMAVVRILEKLSSFLY